MKNTATVHYWCKHVYFLIKYTLAKFFLIWVYYMDQRALYEKLKREMHIRRKNTEKQQIKQDR